MVYAVAVQFLLHVVPLLENGSAHVEKGIMSFRRQRNRSESVFDNINGFKIKKIKNCHNFSLTGLSLQEACLKLSCGCCGSVELTTSFIIAFRLFETMVLCLRKPLQHLKVTAIPFIILSHELGSSASAMLLCDICME